MSNRTKNIIYTFMLLASMLAVWKYRQAGAQQPIAFGGETMGTTYSVKYFDKADEVDKASVDSLLQVFNSSLNHYLPTSELSSFNEDSAFQFKLPYFYEVLKGSQYVFDLSNGAFDPTVMPLVNAWGFGPKKDIKPDSTMIDSLRQFVGFDKVGFDKNTVWKKDPRARLDFSAVAKGYGIDVVVEFLMSKGIENLFVEIGGEVVCRGKNLQNGKPWHVAILDPESTALNQKAKVGVALENKAMATSANNFNYRIIDGVKYSHTISPATGYPIKRAILSATVFADNCMVADAMATSFMVMGHQRAIEVLESTADIEAYLVFSTPEGNVSSYMTNGIRPFIKNLN